MEPRKKKLAARVDSVVMRACTSGGGGGCDGEVDPKKGAARDMGVDWQEGERGSGARWTMDRRRECDIRRSAERGGRGVRDDNATR